MDKLGNKQGLKNEILEPIRTYDYEVVCGAVEKKEYPTKFEISREDTGFLKDQKFESCVGCVIAQIAEVIYKRKMGEAKEMSEDFAYGAFRDEMNKNVGMYVGNALKYWTKIGCVPKDTFDITLEMPELRDLIDQCPELYDIAKNNKIGGYVSLGYASKEKRDLAVKQELSKPNPLPLVAASSNFSFGGGHCFEIVGWDDEKDQYIIKNSWGESYGDKGFAGYPKNKVNEIYAVIPEDIVIPFTDVPEDAWYYKYIKHMYFNGFIKGTSETTFEPEKPMTRAEVATLMYNLSTAMDDRFKILNDVIDEKLKYLK